MAEWLAGSGTTERDNFQREAVSAVLQAYQTADRCQVYAPTGSGKTAVAVKVWERLAVPGIFVMVGPTRSVGQVTEKFSRYYDEEPAQPVAHLQVSSNLDATRDPDEIIRFLRQECPRALTVTDTSLPLVTDALRALSLQADLFVVDETHRNTSARTSNSPRALWAEQAVIELPARRRLYMTATPRTWGAKAADLIIFSQDDEEKYGPVAYELSFDDAVRRGIVLPIVLYALQPEDEKIADQFMADPRVRQEWGGQTLDYREIITHVAIWRARTDGLPDQDHPGERYWPRRILVSFNRVSEVKGFVARHEQIMQAIGVHDGMAFGFVGSTPAGQRELIHESVSKLQGPDGPLAYAVIAQCGALTESYDLPDLDMAILVTPKHSTVAIQQLIGRITRKPVEATGKKWASVLTTDLVIDSAELADTIIAGVVRALMAQSDTFRHQLQAAEIQDDSGRPPVRIAADIDGQRLPDAFFEKLRLAFVPVTPDPWFPEFLAHLDVYIAEHGDALVPEAYVSRDGYMLGKKVQHVRMSRPGLPRPRYRLTPEWLKNLDARGFIWSVPAVQFQEFISRFREYVAQHGDGLVPQNYICLDGYKLGQRVSSVRQSLRDPATRRYTNRHPEYRLTPEQIAELDALGFVRRVRSLNGSQRRIARALTEASRPLTVLEIVDLTDLHGSNVAKCLRQLEGEGRAVRCGKRPSGGGGADLWQALQAMELAD